MTANEQRNLFKELYDGASAQEMGFDDKEVNRFLNLAMDTIINEKFFAYRNKTMEGFEIGSKREAELNNLKKSLSLWKNLESNEWNYKDIYDNIILQNVNVINDKIMNDNSIIVDVPDNMLYILRDTIDLKYNDKLYRNIKVKGINEDNINEKIKSPFSKPNKKVAYRGIEKENNDIHRSIKLYIMKNSIFKRWNVTYFKRPNRIVCDILNPSNQVNCELDESIHNDIVFKAVGFALGSIGSQKVQIANYDVNSNVN